MLGLRHAFDADHIAAIDNVTRKLMQTGQRPVAAGLYFSLGHSAVVWLASIGIAVAVNTAGPPMEFMHHVGGYVGTGVSALFLLGIAAANLVVLKGIIGAIRRRRRGETIERKELDQLLVPKGLYTRLVQPVFRMVSRSWHMLIVGMLFGLGFDTATEIGVLGISATAAGSGMPIWFILIFPALFTAGMSLVDTLDSTLMSGAYGWAFVDPGRKLYYNLTITFLSVVAALVVGGIEAMTLIPEDLWRHTAEVPEGAGYAIAAVLALLWAAWTLLHRSRVPKRG
jgi:nickel/cobalt transporter (NiCoT) family protein